MLGQQNFKKIFWTKPKRFFFKKHPIVNSLMVNSDIQNIWKNIQKWKLVQI